MVYVDFDLGARCRAGAHLYFPPLDDVRCLSRLRRHMERCKTSEYFAVGTCFCLIFTRIKSV